MPGRGRNPIIQLKRGPLPAAHEMVALIFGPDFVRPSMGRSLRFTILPLALALSACASSSLPRVKVAKTQLADVSDGRSQSGRRLIQALRQAEAASADLEAGSIHYNAAVEAFVLGLQRRLSPHDWTKPVQVQDQQRTWQVSFDDRPMQPQGNDEYAPAFFDRILPAGRINTKAFAERLEGPGLGAPFVLALEKDLEALRRDRAFRPGNGLYAPATAVLEFGKPAAQNGNGIQPVRLRFVNSFPQRQVTLAGQRRPLAYDYTSVIEANLDNPYLAGIRLSGLLRPDRREKDLGLFGLAPYDPAKVPVVYRARPRLHPQHLAPTGERPSRRPGAQPPLPAAALRLPDRHKRARRSRSPAPEPAALPPALGPATTKPALRTHGARGPQHGRPSLAIAGDGHGGGVAEGFLHSAIQRSTGCRAQERGDAAHAGARALPFVDRVVFIAVPHRGSKLADVGLVQLAVRLIKLPTDTLGFITRAVTSGGLQFINPELHRSRQLGLRSVDVLSAEHPYFAALERCPVTVPAIRSLVTAARAPAPSAPTASCRMKARTSPVPSRRSSCPTGTAALNPRPWPRCCAFCGSICGGEGHLAKLLLA